MNDDRVFAAFANGDRIALEAEERRLTGLSKTTRWRMVRRGEWPPSIKISPGRTGRKISDVVRALEERAAASRGSGS